MKVGKLCQAAVSTKTTSSLFTCLCSSIQRKPVDDGKIIAVNGTVLDISIVAADQETDHIQVTSLARCGQHPVQQVHPQTWTWGRATTEAVQEQPSGLWRRGDLQMFTTALQKASQKHLRRRLLLSRDLHFVVI